MTTRPSLSVVVPAYNEAENIVVALTRVLVALNSTFIRRYEIIVVDDGSTDGTADRVREWAQLIDPPILIFCHERNFGLRAAYETGLAAAQYEYVTWVPGDGEMVWTSIADILRAIGTADLVVPYHGTPERRSWFRRLLTWGSTLQINWLLGHRLRYYQGTVVYPTDLARRLPRTEPGFFFNTEMLCWALEEGLSYVQVPLVHQERQYGVSKAVSLGKIWAAQKAILRFWWRLRIRPVLGALGFAWEYR